MDYPKIPDAAMAAFQTRLPVPLLADGIAASHSPKPSEVKAGGERMGWASTSRRLGAHCIGNSSTIVAVMGNRHGSNDLLDVALLATDWLRQTGWCE